MQICRSPKGDTVMEMEGSKEGQHNSKMSRGNENKDISGIQQHQAINQISRRNEENQKHPWHIAA